MDVDRRPCERCGEVHTKCSGHTKHGPNTGKPCGANPPLGQLVCTKHGGNHPAQKKKGRERLLELVDPFIAELNRIVLDPDTEPSVKVRGILGLLDRTGHGPGQTVTLKTTPWDEMIGELTADAIGLNRDLGPSRDRNALPSSVGGGEEDPIGVEDAEQHSRDEQTRQWATYDHEDEEPYSTRMDPYGSNVVRGEVVDQGAVIFPPDPAPRKRDDLGGTKYPGRYDVPPDRDPLDPPRYADEAE